MRFCSCSCVNRKIGIVNTLTFLYTALYNPRLAALIHIA